MRILTLSICLILTQSAISQSPTATYPAAISSRKEIYTATKCQLLDWYRKSDNITPPTGFIPGRVLPFPGKRINKPVSTIMHLTVWQGKVFCTNESMINKMFGVKMAPGVVGVENGFLDGRPSITINYPKSLIFGAYRDEIREIAPGIYLGLMYNIKSDCPVLTSYFILESRCCCQK